VTRWCARRRRPMRSAGPYSNDRNVWTFGEVFFAQGTKALWRELHRIPYPLWETFTGSGRDGRGPREPRRRLPEDDGTHGIELGASDGTNAGRRAGAEHPGLGRPETPDTCRRPGIRLLFRGWDAWRDIRQPVGAWYSRDDTVDPIEHGRRLVAAIPNAEGFTRGAGGVPTSAAEARRSDAGSKQERSEACADTENSGRPLGASAKADSRGGGGGCRHRTWLGSRESADRGRVRQDHRERALAAPRESPRVPSNGAWRRAGRQLPNDASERRRTGRRVRNRCQPASDLERRIHRRQTSRPRRAISGRCSKRASRRS
jgi:hypothetical protein